MNNNVPKMRLIREIYEELHNADPDSAITMYALRQLVKSGKIPCTKVGRKMLINYNDVLDYFKTHPETTAPIEIGEIRRVV